VGIILEERMFLAKERFWNVEWFFCVTLNRGQISPFYRRTKTENEKSYLFKKNGNNGWEGSNVQKSYLFKKNGNNGWEGSNVQKSYLFNKTVITASPLGTQFSITCSQLHVGSTSVHSALLLTRFQALTHNCIGLE
jgi:hypothetical protein